jgi:hypothetical protein
MADPGRLREAPWYDLGLVVFFSALIFTYAHFQAFRNPYIINDDVRQQIFWMQQWRDPELFRGDLLSDYARHYVTWGVKGLYRLAAPVLDPISLSKVLPGALFLFLAGCLYRIGEFLGQRPLAWMTVAVFWLMPFFLDNISGGLARSFAAPLLALFWLGWLKQSPRGMGMALFLQALFIPYIFILSASAALIAWGAGRFRMGHPPPFPTRPAHLALMAVAASLVLLMYHQINAAGYGPLVSAADMANRPEFTSRGRLAILPLPSFFWELISPWELIAPIREGGIIGGVLGIPLLVGLAAYGAWKVAWRSLIPRLQPVWYLGMSSLLFYFLARVLLLKLFLPDRYLIYTLNLFYCLLLAMCWGAAIQVRRWPRTLAVLALIGVTGLSGLRLKNVDLYDYSLYRPLFAALAQTPKGALIAGHPNLMDTVPTFARRRAFATFELAQPWCQGYWQEMRPRLEELFTAYYAADPNVVRDFCRRRQIDFLVVDDRHFTPAFLAGGWCYVPGDNPAAPGQPKPRLAERIWSPFFAPFDEQIRRQVQGRQQFALLDPEAFRRQALSEHLWLLDMRPKPPDNP